MYFTHVSGKRAVESKNKKDKKNFESGTDTFEVDNSHLSLTDERVGKTACGFPWVRRATPDPRHLSVARRDAPWRFD